MKSDQSSEIKLPIMSAMWQNWLP